MTEMNGSLLEKAHLLRAMFTTKPPNNRWFCRLRYIELFVEVNDYSKVIPILRRVAIFKKCCAMAMSKIAIPIGLKITGFSFGMFSM